MERGARLDERVAVRLFVLILDFLARHAQFVSPYVPRPNEVGTGEQHRCNTNRPEQLHHQSLDHCRHLKWIDKHSGYDITARGTQQDRCNRGHQRELEQRLHKLDLSLESEKAFPTLAQRQF